MDSMALSEILIIGAINCAVIFFFINFSKKIVDGLEKMIEKTTWTMFLWDRCLFGRNFYLKLLKWRQDLIYRLRGTKIEFPQGILSANERLAATDTSAPNADSKSEFSIGKRILYYVLATRPQYLVGFVSLIYALICLLTAESPMERFSEMASNTIAGTFEDLAGIAGIGEDSGGLGAVFAAAIGNYFCFWIFLPRFDSAMDKAFWKKNTGFSTSKLPRILMWALEPLFFAATALFFSDMFNANFFETLGNFFTEATNSIAGAFDGLGELIVLPIVLLTLFALFQPVAKAFVYWFRDTINAVLVFTIFLTIGSLISLVEERLAVSDDILLLICLLLSQRIPDWFARLKDLLWHKKDSEKFRPRKYIRRRCKEFGCFPEHYDLEEHPINFGDGVMHRQKAGKIRPVLFMGKK